MGHTQGLATWTLFILHMHFFPNEVKVFDILNFLFKCILEKNLGR